MKVNCRGHLRVRPRPTAEYARTSSDCPVSCPLLSNFHTNAETLTVHYYSPLYQSINYSHFLNTTPAQCSKQRDRTPPLCSTPRLHRH
ncbi:hypothetical protein G7K_4210-t1 [Saitoella complicata NRRL Y-17804]|uniref:Uncharacterized protein n=1 Tax=Saitoella complicata (strain BCRC 22490 / CBS 7301 / JCM 7358 / NBRC 10748 / NRRL Y-17804) TaxID=698492 RepID=A0A0E9NKY6_SAICN|nr:hypothetical protein G7K_4210-t1 [Saitoella complicata NRRL Y-17804]